MAKYRAWCFTVNNYCDQDEETVFGLALDTVSVKYIVAGKEVGESGTPHLQGYIYFVNQRSLGGLKELLPTAHWESARGTPKEASDYCKKDDDYFESGTLPMDQSQKGECGKQSIAERWALAKAGRLEELPPENIRVYMYIAMLNAVVADLPELTNLWIYGKSGIGKSSFVRKSWGDAIYSKALNKWWDGFQGEDIVVVDDMDPKHDMLGYHLKIWGDHYAFTAEIKNGCAKIRPKRIIITSQYRPESVWPNEPETVEAIHRRYKFINFDLGLPRVGSL